jgi:hypothetical protein
MSARPVSVTLAHLVARGTHHAELAIPALKLHVEALMHSAGYQYEFFGALRADFGPTSYSRQLPEHGFESGERLARAATVPA